MKQTGAKKPKEAEPAVASRNDAAKRAEERTKRYLRDLGNGRGRFIALVATPFRAEALRDKVLAEHKQILAERDELRSENARLRSEIKKLSEPLAETERLRLLLATVGLLMSKAGFGEAPEGLEALLDMQYSGAHYWSTK